MITNRADPESLSSGVGMLIFAAVLFVLFWVFLIKVTKSGKSGNVDESEGSVGANRDYSPYGDEDVDVDDLIDGFEDFDEADEDDGYDDDGESDDGDEFPEPTVYHNVRVVKKSCGIGYSGIGRNKYAVHHTYFNILFAFEDGSEELYDTDEELFNSLSEGQTGDLILMGNRFLGFE